MTMTSALSALEEHPELQLEQGYVTRAYELLDAGLADVEQTFASYQEGVERPWQHCGGRSTSSATPADPDSWSSVALIKAVSRSKC